MGCKVAFLLLLCSMSSGARGADIFRWLDENGKVHYGDSVPERYKQKAKRVELKDVEPTGAQRPGAAGERARTESPRAREAGPTAPQSGSAQTPDATPARADGCEEQMKRYLDSLACFDAYRSAKGGIKPEAFQNCTEVKQPAGCTAAPDPSDRNYIPTAPPAP
jgi:hypothetical protein